jgi:3-isopropylmalate dehydrogenase
LDILIVRELTGGIYFAEPRGIEQISEEIKKGYDTNLYTTPEIKRIGRVAIDLAKARKAKVTSVEKANVMMSGVLWREVMTSLFNKEGHGIETSHMYADNCAMQLVRDPKQFDVIVTDNLFGDILSDCAAMLTGSLGMLPSASLGAADKNTGKRFAMYEPVHGSAPDIAGKGLANPLAELLSLSMLLRYSFDMKEEADLIDEAVSNALDVGPRTPDILAPGREKVGTQGMMDLVIRKLEELSK